MLQLECDILNVTTKKKVIQYTQKAVRRKFKSFSIKTQLNIRDTNAQWQKLIPPYQWLL